MGGIKWKTLGIGEVVDANRMASTPYKLNFKTDRKEENICTKSLNADELQKFRTVGAATCCQGCAATCMAQCSARGCHGLAPAPGLLLPALPSHLLPSSSDTIRAAASAPEQAVEDDWYFQMYYDDLPVWGFIGKMEKIIRQGQSEYR